MHYIVGWPKVLDLQHLVTAAKDGSENSNSENRPSFRIVKLTNVSQRWFIILTGDSLSIWQHEPALELACHTRLSASVEKLGSNCSICVQQVSPFVRQSQTRVTVAVSTTKSTILFYTLVFSSPDEDGVDLERSYVETAQSGAHVSPHAESACATVQITPLRSAKLQNCGTLMSMCSVGEYLFAAMQNGTVQRLRWLDAQLEKSIDLHQLDFYTDLLNSRPTRLPADEETFVRSMQHCPLLNSVSVLLSNGKGALLTPPPLRNNVQRPEGSQTESKAVNADESLLEASTVESAGELIAIWPEHLKHATCMAVNDRYRAIAFGGRSTESTVYTLDEESGSLECAFKLKLTTKDYPNAPALCGSVVALRWSPDETMLVTVWERFGFAFWSVFGRLLFTTLSFVQETLSSHIDCRFLPTRHASRHDSVGNDSQMLEPVVRGDGETFVLENVSQVEFDAFGYRLYVSSELQQTCELTCFTLAKNAHSLSPTNAECGAHLLLHTDTQIYLQTSEQADGGLKEPNASAVRTLQTLTLPVSYSQVNAPIRFVSLSSNERCVAAFGERGFCVYQLQEKKWRLFLNEAQEREFLVWPGTVFWPCGRQDAQLLGCVVRTADNRTDELRIYAVRQKLDTRNACVAKLFAVPNESFVPADLNGSPYVAHLFQERFLVVYSRFSNSAVLYALEGLICADVEPRRLDICKVQEVSLTSVILQPFSVVSVYLSSLHTESLVSLNRPPDASPSNAESRKRCLATFGSIRSIIINYAGRVFLVQSHCAQSTRNVTGPGSQPTVKPAQPQHTYLPLVSAGSRNSQSRYKPVLFVLPAVTLATGIETVWFDYSYRVPWSYEVIWLNAGQSGIRVWLPLIAVQTGSQTQSHNLQASSLQGSQRMNVFLSKRMMLAFQPSASGTATANGGFYVTALSAQDAQLVGLQCELHAYVREQSSSNNSPYCLWYRQLPFVSWSRSQVPYMHSIIVQLLRKNLGVYALEFAQHFAAQRTQNFELSLELLIHELIEEEAVTKVPIPDPLLPRAVEFLREFPSCYYRTMAYVLRKTEMNLWPYVIKSIGPQTTVKDLFEQCLYLSDSPNDSASFCPLNVAACYFLVLQNLEPTSFSKQHALLLLDRALRHEQWTLANDLVRYLKAIDPAEIDDCPPALPSPVGSSVVNNSSANTNSSKQNVEQKSNRSEKQSQLVRRVSAAAGRSRSPPHSPVGNLSLQIGLETEEHHSAADSVRKQLDQTMVKHCRSLLCEYRLRKLGRFAANVPDFHLLAFLKKDAARTQLIDCVVTALNQIHRDFRWPMPILLPTVETISLLKAPFHTRSPSDSLADDASFATTLTSGSRAEASSCDSQRAALQLLGSSIAQQGCEQSEAELRYLYHVFCEADSLDFSLLICIVLRDERLFVELVDTFLLRCTGETRSQRVDRLLTVLNELLDWSTDASAGYYPFLSRLDERVRSALNVPVGYSATEAAASSVVLADGTVRVQRCRIASESCARSDGAVARSHTLTFEKTTPSDGQAARDTLSKSKSEGEALSNAAVANNAVTNANSNADSTGAPQQDSGYCVIS